MNVLVGEWSMSRPVSPTYAPPGTGEWGRPTGHVVTGPTTLELQLKVQYDPKDESEKKLITAVLKAFKDIVREDENEGTI